MGTADTGTFYDAIKTKNAFSTNDYERFTLDYSTGHRANGKNKKIAGTMVFLVHICYR